MEIRDVDGTTVTVGRSISDPSLVSVEVIDVRGQGGSAYLDLPAVVKLVEAFQLAMGAAPKPHTITVNITGTVTRDDFVPRTPPGVFRGLGGNASVSQPIHNVHPVR